MDYLEGVDYYINEQGNWVFTAKYLLKRGYCCQNGCRHCPYGGIKKKQVQDKKQILPLRGEDSVHHKPQDMQELNTEE